MLRPVSGQWCHICTYTVCSRRVMYIVLRLEPFIYYRWRESVCVCFISYFYFLMRFRAYCERRKIMSAYTEAFAWEEQLTTWPYMDILQEQEVLLIGRRRQCLCRNQWGGAIVFLFLCLCEESYLYRFAARGRHITNRVKRRCSEEAGPGTVQWTPEQWGAVGISVLKIVECLNPQEF